MPARPELGDLLARFGSYGAIPDEAWQAYDRAIAEYRATMHERHRISTSTVAAGVHLVHSMKDERRFARWLDHSSHPRLVARAIWRALKTPQSRARLEHWMKNYLQKELS